MTEREEIELLKKAIAELIVKIESLTNELRTHYHPPPFVEPSNIRKLGVSKGYE